jgi:hypothetical protein
MFIGVSERRHRGLVQWVTVYEKETAMRRFSVVLTAAVACAMVVVALSALDAVGAGSSPPNPKADVSGQLVQCLRDRGVAVPALTGRPLERWLQAHEPPLATARACKEAVAKTEAPPGRTPADDKADLARITACLRAHGLRPPTAAMDLKRWILAHEGDAAVGNALQGCGMAPPPGCGDKDGQGAAPAPGSKDGQAD